MINLGCGSRFHSDWINIDCVAQDPSVLVHDLSKGIPFGDNTCDVVYQSHVLEHLPRNAAKGMLQECRRVLRPGGILRVAVPDLEQVCRMYLQKLEAALAGDVAAAHDHEWMVVELIDQCIRQKSGGAMREYLQRDSVPNLDFVVARIGEEARGLINKTSSPTSPSLVLKVKQAVRDAVDNTRRVALRLLGGPQSDNALEIGRFRISGEPHLWMYDRLSLKVLLLDAGFSTVEASQAGVSEVENWANYHLEVLPDGRIIKPDSLYMEAKK
ncbi:TPA: methyltransferase type 11 [Candidatus Sumerlaeota bacterium]|jgi:SAM-dependent methyltransferase|nr:methyltransferase type 11 [Candidatus Sumerlaeota bacterium]